MKELSQTNLASSLYKDFRKLATVGVFEQQFAVAEMFFFLKLYGQVLSKFVTSWIDRDMFRRFPLRV